MKKRTFIELMQQHIAEYRESGQPWPAQRRDIARWLIKNKKWNKTGETLLDVCARDVSRAMREEFYTDPQNRRVRTKHAARFIEKHEDGSIAQATFWGDMRTEPREFMERAFHQHRRQIVGECLSLSNVVDSYNDNMCPDEPIQLLLDFSDDVADLKQTGEFSFEKTPAEESDDSSEFELPSLQSPFDVSPKDSSPELPHPSSRQGDQAPRRPGSSVH